MPTWFWKQNYVVLSHYPFLDHKISHLEGQILVSHLFIWILKKNLFISFVCLFIYFFNMAMLFYYDLKITTTRSLHMTLFCLDIFQNLWQADLENRLAASLCLSRTLCSLMLLLCINISLYTHIFSCTHMRTHAHKYIMKMLTRLHVKLGIQQFRSLWCWINPLENYSN